jgi:uncharacterized small protein (DUF1192 family)
MDEEDPLPRSKKPEPRNIEVLSIEALGEYIAELEAEIARVQAEIEAKRAHLSGAEAIFRK